jgi:hypothetical protein
MSDFFDGFKAFEGFAKGLAGFMPQDDPATRVFSAQSELNDLKQQESELFEQLGRRVFTSDGIERFPTEAEQIAHISKRRIEVQQQLDSALAEEEAARIAKDEARAATTCPQCGLVNAEGFNFCQDCGTKLGIQTKSTCPSCNTVNAPDVKFCGNCGTRLGAPSE